MARAVERVRWRTGALGCVIPILIMATGLFATAAVRPSLAADLATERRGAWIALTQSVTVGGVNIPLALLALFLGYEIYRMARRWIDVDAVIATEDAILFHPTTRLRKLVWGDVESIRFAKVKSAPALIIDVARGRQHIVRGVDVDDEAATSFMSFAQNRIDYARGAAPRA